MEAALLQLQGLQQLLHGLENSRGKKKKTTIRRQINKTTGVCSGGPSLQDLAAWRTVPRRHGNNTFPFKASPSNVPPETLEDKNSEAENRLGSFYLRSHQYSRQSVVLGDKRQHPSCEEDMGEGLLRVGRTGTSSSPHHAGLTILGWNGEISSL